MPSHMPLEEFDPGRAVIEPSDVLKPHPDMPPCCVLTMHPGQFDQLASRPESRKIFRLRSCMGPHPVYVLDHEGASVAVAHPGIGAPLAVALSEELIARGARALLVTGTCGVIDPDIPKGMPVLVTSALRDEGTSFHYQPPGRCIESDPTLNAAVRRQCVETELPFEEVLSWTTDAFYRETPEKVKRRREEGCRTVDMETSALFALGRFRNVPVAALLWAMDDVTGQTWQTRKDHAPQVKPDALFQTLLAVAAKYSV